MLKTDKLRLIVVAVILLVFVSGCAGMHSPDMRSAGWLDVSAGPTLVKVWVYDLDCYTSGFWTGGENAGFANGEGTLILYKAKEKVAQYRGNMENGLALGNGSFVLGKYNTYGELVTPFIVYEGQFHNGLPNGAGIMEVYKETGAIDYILKGTFKRAAVIGYYQYTKDGKTETRNAKVSK